MESVKKQFTQFLKANRQSGSSSGPLCGRFKQYAGRTGGGYKSECSAETEKLLCALPEKYYNIGLSRIYELAEKYPKPYRHLMRSVNNGWEQAEKYLEKGMEEGMIREVSIPVVMAMVKGTVYCFMESDILYQNKLTYEQAKKEMVEILMKGIKTGGKSKDSGN